MNKPEWERQFKAEIVRTLTGHENNDGPLWTHDEAMEAAEAELQGQKENVGDDMYENDPASEAMECMSYWDGDDEE